MSYSMCFAAVGCKGEAADQAVQSGLFEVMHSRTSIRRFDPERDVPDNLVEKLLRAAMSAPTAMNSQPWEFVVVRDSTLLKALAAGLPNSRIANGARLVIIVCGNTDNGLRAPRAKEYWIQDCSAASQNLLLAAKCLGLGAVWTGIYPMKDRIEVTKKILGIPERFMPLNAIPIGWPAENPKPKDKWKPDRVHHDRW